MARLSELMELAYAGDEDVVDQVAWEVGLMPTDAAETRLRAEAAAAEIADQYAPDEVPQISPDELARLAEDAGF